MGLMTEDGSTPIVRGPICILMFTGDLGGGTLTVRRLIDRGDPSIDSNWVPLADSSGAAVYTISPGGARYDVRKTTNLKATLTDSTNPNLEYTFND